MRKKTGEFPFFVNLQIFRIFNALGLFTLYEIFWLYFNILWQHKKNEF